jgi:hypothetical protein
MRKPVAVFALVVAVLFLPGVRKLSAQPVTVAKIPFSFIVEGAVMPAGEYRLAMRQGDQATMHIASTCGRVAAFVSVSPAGAVTDTGEPTLVFRRIGNGYFLSKVNVPGEQGREIAVPTGAAAARLVRLIKGRPAIQG